MAVNKNESQHTILTGAGLAATNRIVLITPTVDATVQLGGDVNTGLIYYIDQILNKTWLTTSIVHSSSGSITCGDMTVYRGAYIKYCAERGTTCYKTGTIEIIHDGTYTYANDSNIDTIDEEERGDKWLSVSLKVNGAGQLTITFITDSEDTDTTYITYKIIDQIPIHS